jgi:hypothetical protein
LHSLSTFFSHMAYFNIVSFPSQLFKWLSLTWQYFTQPSSSSQSFSFLKVSFLLKIHFVVLTFFLQYKHTLFFLLFLTPLFHRFGIEVFISFSIYIVLILHWFPDDSFQEWLNDWYPIVLWILSYELLYFLIEQWTNYSKVFEVFESGVQMVQIILILIIECFN